MNASKPGPSRASLMKKRRKALWLILSTATLTGGASGAPTPGLEGPKQAVVTAADITLLAGIYNAYFDEDVSPTNMRELLKEAGILVAVGGSVVYGGVKFTEAGLAEVLNFVPGFGWLVSGLITASVTATVAAMWWWYCDYQARNGAIPLTAIQAQPA
jgi:hypothetical protein